MRQLTRETINRSKVSAGNRARLISVMRRAAAGEPITIGALGGSITEGYFASKPENNYASRVTQWWRDTFPKAAVSLINAGIGATGSLVATHRVQGHLLDKKPDVIVVEFAVNDCMICEVASRETFENTVRRCLHSGAAVLVLFTLRQEGPGVQDEQIEIGRHYDLPMIAVSDAIWPELQSGVRRWEDYSNDTVHPNDNGHELVATLVNDYLNEVYAVIDTATDVEQAMPAPLTSADFEHAYMLDHRTLPTITLGSFVKHERGFEHFHHAWFAENGGDAMEFEVTDCRCLHLVMLKEPNERAGIAHITVTVDGQDKNIDFQASFPGGWGGYAYPVLAHRSAEPKTVRVSIKPERTIMLMQVFMA